MTNEEFAAELAAIDAKRGRLKVRSRKLSGFVYFVRCGSVGGPIKIGYAADVAARLSGMQTGCPQPLRLLLAIPGSQALEAGLHAAFCPAKLRGEWFHPCAQLLAFIEAAKGAATEEPEPIPGAQRPKPTAKPVAKMTAEEITQKHAALAAWAQEEVMKEITGIR